MVFRACLVCVFSTFVTWVMCTESKQKGSLTAERIDNTNAVVGRLFVYSLRQWSENEGPFEDSVSEYTVKFHNGRKEIDEKITIDTENETETLYIEDDGPPGEVYAIFDFKRNFSMYRTSHPNVCFLSNSTGNQPKPADLIKLLKSEALQGPTQPKEAKRTSEYSIVREIHDRSFLSDEMAIMCAKQRIFYMEPESVTVDVQKQTNRKRRNLIYCVHIIWGPDEVYICDENPIIVLPPVVIE